MKNRQIFALSALALATRLAFAADPASVSLVLFDQKQPVPNAQIIVDGQPVATTSEDGAVHLSMEPGKHSLEVMRDSQSVVQVELDVVEDESAEIIATLYPDAAPSIFIESSNENAAGAAKAEVADGPPGTLSGRVINADDKKPIAGAQVFVSGMPIDVRTGEDGSYTLEVPAGKFSVSIVAPQYATQTKNDVEIASEQTTTQNIELTPSGVELPEFVVIEPFVEGSLASFVEEKRTSAAVTDVLGAEQISRNGDSDAAGALKRVTGLTLVDGKFVYIRGLGERYSSTLLNGATVPSPDPTRRVVPLDLFPTTILQGITVQKTYSADMPGEFGGGVVQLRTRGVPESFLLKASLGYTYIDGTTGAEGLRYRGGGTDWRGVDDGSREAPDALLAPQLPSGEALNELSDDLVGKGLRFYPETLGDSGSGSVAIGDKFTFGDGDWSLGYILAGRFSHEWDQRDEERARYGLSGDKLFKQAAFERKRTQRGVDASGYAALGIKIGEHHDVFLNAIDLRQTTDQVRWDVGGIDALNDREARSKMEWIENELLTFQATGEHSFPALNNLFVGWQVTDSEATRYSPFTREFKFQPRTGDNQDNEEFQLSYFNEQIRYENLLDNSLEYRLDLKFPISLGDDDTLTLLAGATQLTRDRDSLIRRYAFSNRRPQGLDHAFNPELIYNPITVGDDFIRDFVLSDVGRVTDSYKANVDLQTYYYGADLVWDDWRVNIGARQEDYAQEVVTKRPFSDDGSEERGGVDSSDLLPAGSITWAYSEKAQVRLGYSKTVARPDLREQATSTYTDPLLDVSVQGNPDLKPTDITSLDARWEYYFSPTESFSIAYFKKEFINPIELVARPASGDLLGVANAESAVNSGIELDFYKSLGFVDRWKWMPDFMHWPAWKDIYFSANYAKIESTIELGANSGIATNASRPLQGQSPYVANVSLSYLHPEGTYESTLLYNVFGERIQRVGQSGVPDVYEQPFNQLDFNLKAKLPWDGWTAKVKVKNILDDTVEVTAGEFATQKFKKGREFGVSIEWKY